MSFSDDEQHWIEFLYRLNLLSQQHYTGSFYYCMKDGRVSRKTRQLVCRLVQPYVEHLREEDHAQTSGTR